MLHRTEKQQMLDHSWETKRGGVRFMEKKEGQAPLRDISLKPFAAVQHGLSLVSGRPNNLVRRKGRSVRKRKNMPWREVLVEGTNGEP